MAPSEFGFALGWGLPLIDDCYLGHASGIQPDIYIMHNCCDPGRYPETHQAWTWSRKMLAERYRLVEVENTYWPYWIYVRKDLLAPSGFEQAGYRATRPRLTDPANHAQPQKVPAAAAARRSRS